MACRRLDGLPTEGGRFPFPGEACAAYALALSNRPAEFGREL